ncbi:hypothetical protein LMANV2_370045 [Leptospira interrogans serovar Manilae]|uniref:Uncharacterized protein n=1 Tax=Leptospira interrogans serovar Manilae TaxID=214675 RepID=A0AAQ1NYD4_LEPIR|nr:hypothetical protein LMANV2_370045 [Leptospira interrogans serovar Manilae]
MVPIALEKLRMREVYQDFLIYLQSGFYKKIKLAYKYFVRRQ